MEIRRVFIHSQGFQARSSSFRVFLDQEKFVIFERERETKRSFYHKWTCSCLSHCPSSPPKHAAEQPPQPKTYVTTSIIAFESVWSITKIHHENDWDLLLQWIGSNQKHVARLLTNSSVLFPFASVNLRHPFNTVVCGNDGRCRTMRGPVRGWGGNPWRLLLLEIQSHWWWRRCRLCQRNNVFDKPSRHGRQRSCWSCLPICRKWRVCRR